MTYAIRFEIRGKKRSLTITARALEEAQRIAEDHLRSIVKRERLNRLQAAINYELVEFEY